MKFKCTNFYSYFEHIGSRGNQKKQLRLNSLTIVSPKIGRDTVQILAWDVTAIDLKHKLPLYPVKISVAHGFFSENSTDDLKLVLL